VTDNWRESLESEVIPRLKAGLTLIGFCIGGHGRTGTLIASLIALLEPETDDPIAAARERHCRKAVETRAQAEGIYALRGEELPEKYVAEFRR
jgi:hypothetical protein